MAAQRALTEAPSIHDRAEVLECELGVWTEIGDGTRMVQSSLGDFSYITRHCDVVWTTIGKFCSIADYTRMNPGNHPTWRVCQHHSVYRAAAYELGEDETEFFAWRKSNWVTLGHDVWVGHGALIDLWRPSRPRAVFSPPCAAALSPRRPQAL